METTAVQIESVHRLSQHSSVRSVRPPLQDVRIREAQEADAGAISALFHEIYQGKYPLEFGSDTEVLRAELRDDQRYLWLIAEDLQKPEKPVTAGALLLAFDSSNRIGKAAGAVVRPDYRNGGLGAALLKTGVKHLTEDLDRVDVIYSTTRTINEGPSRMVAEAGFRKMGLFPNAIRIQDHEHLNLDVYLTERALSSRRRRPFLFGPFYDVYRIARASLGLERAHLVTERAPLKLARAKIPLKLEKDASEVVSRFRRYALEQRLSNSFFPFHAPNWMLATQDGGTEVFIYYGGIGKQASILGYRTDRVNIHDLLDSVAHALEESGASYVELLIDAYDYKAQQEAYTARYIPSAYFPAMCLKEDGLRDDYFVLSRTFRLLDFTGTVISGDNLKYLQAYLRSYYSLYIEPLIGAANAVNSDVSN